MAGSEERKSDGKLIIIPACFACLLHACKNELSSLARDRLDCNGVIMLCGCCAIRGVCLTILQTDTTMCCNYNPTIREYIMNSKTVTNCCGPISRDRPRGNREKKGVGLIGRRTFKNNNDSLVYQSAEVADGAAGL